MISFVLRSKLSNGPQSPAAAVPVVRKADADSTMTYFDSAGILPQCGEGPGSYMTNCVLPCDFVGYLLSAKPVLVPGAHCSSMGFTFATMDNIYVRTFFCSHPCLDSSSGLLWSTCTPDRLVLVKWLPGHADAG